MEDFVPEEEKKSLQVESSTHLLEMCNHLFHRECLSYYFKSQIDQNKFPIHCPNVECKKEVRIDEIEGLLDKKSIKTFYKRTFNLAADTQKDISWCPTAGCEFAFLFDGEKELNCPKCAKHFCLKCKVPFHKGMTCL